MFVAIIAGLPIPLIATQLLWINLVTDSFPAIALGMDSSNSDVMKDKPRTINENFFSQGAGRRVVIVGIMVGLLTIFAFLSGYYVKGFSPFADNIPEDIHEYSRTFAFLTLVAAQLFYSLSFRHEYKSIFSKELFGNKFLLGSILLGFLLQLLVIEVPFLAEAFKLQSIGFYEWMYLLGLGIIPLLLNEIEKIFRRRCQK